MREVTNGAHWSQKCTLTTLANDTKKLSVSKPGVDSMKPGCRCELDLKYPEISIKEKRGSYETYDD